MLLFFCVFLWKCFKCSCTFKIVLFIDTFPLQDKYIYRYTFNLVLLNVVVVKYRIHFGKPFGKLQNTFWQSIWKISSYWATKNFFFTKRTLFCLKLSIRNRLYFFYYITFVVTQTSARVRACLRVCVTPSILIKS